MPIPQYPDLGTRLFSATRQGLVSAVKEGLWRIVKRASAQPCPNPQVKVEKRRHFKATLSCDTVPEQCRLP